ncbi:MAG: hypothetical protein U9O63_08465, partial [Actinomycetota bacterium]|nr:hypothetical protein [Actinomycetota bacterium]
AGIGVFGLISASTDSSIERDALDTLAGLDDQLAQLQADTRAVRTEVDAVQADTASTHESVEASEADTSVLEAALEETEDPIRKLQSEAWELYVAVQRVADLENSISDDLDVAVAAGSRRQIGDMISSVTSLESGQLADLDSAVDLLGEAVGNVEALLLVTATEFEVIEDFEGPVQGWQAADLQATGATDGGYVITANDNGYVEWSISPYENANVAIEVTALPVEGADDGLFAYGVLCRTTENEALSGYWFEISGEGGYGVGWFPPSGDFVYLLGQGQSPEAAGLSFAINGGFEENRISVVCDESRFSLTVNGTLIWEGTDDNLTVGNIALGAVTYSDTPVSVRFDDLRLTGVAGQEGG